MLRLSHGSPAGRIGCAHVSIAVSSTSPDWTSNSKLTVTSFGTTSRNSCIDFRTSATTVSAEAVSFLMIGR